MPIIEVAKIQVRRGRENVTGVPQLDPGEFGWAEDTQHLYIGKRISEGAINDDNTRILTEGDLENIFELVNFGGSGSVASTSTYRYRDILPYPEFASTTTTIARKLDQFVSLSDFSEFTPSGDITQSLRRAVRELYANTYLGTSTIRPLKLPAGNFAISGVVDLPPFANIIGDGPGVTTLFLNNGTNIFRTVDALGNSYDDGMQYDAQASQFVHLSNMTLAYMPNNVNDFPLVTLDNTKNAVIDNVQFTTLGANISTSTFVSTGTAITMRNSYGVDESTVSCKDIQIKNCQFKNTRSAIEGIGMVSRPVIENNVFTNLQRALFLTSETTTTNVPVNVLVQSNKFTFIKNSAIEVTTSTGRSNLVSSNNTFFYVGNSNAAPDQTVTTAQLPVMTFNASGNMSINDYFNRQAMANTTSNTFYYNPLINNNAKIVNNSVYNFTVSAAINDQSFIKIPLTGYDQLGIIEYQLSNADMSRKGSLIVNISPDGYASVSDTYNYSESVADASTLLEFSTNMQDSPYELGTHNYITVTCSNRSELISELEFTLTLTV